MAKKEEIIVGLDIGTTKVCCLIAQSGKGELELIGLGSHPSYGGMRKGVIVDIEKTAEAIKCAVEEAEMMSGVNADNVYVGISGGHIKGVNSQGKIALKNREVAQSDIDKVIEMARSVAIPFDREVLHVVPQEFTVDDQEGITNPLGMVGSYLEAKVHIITASDGAVQNIIKCVNQAGLKVKDLVLEQLASSESVLFPEEKELGIALVDIGGGTSDVAIFFDNCLKHTSVLKIGGTQLTNDIAVGLVTPQAEAERIKKTYGNANASAIKGHETLEISSVGERQPRLISKQILCEIIQCRLKELFNLIKRDIAINGYGDLIPSGVVLTGGTSILKGMQEVGENIFGLPLRCGGPKVIKGLSKKIDPADYPIYATAVGLILYGSKNGRVLGQSGYGTNKNFFSKIKLWFKEFF